MHLLIFWSLFHGVDDQGRMEARISTIQSTCLGHLPEDAVDADTVKAALLRMKRLEDRDGFPLIYIYSANGTKVLQIAKWWDFQNGMRNAWPSRWDPMPGWVDDVRGHGKRALTELLKHSGGETVGSPTGSPSSLSIGISIENRVPNGTRRHTSDDKDKEGEKPWALFQAYLDVLGITYKQFPGYRVQLKHAKEMLADGFTADEVRQAAEVFKADPYWVKNGFDLSVIRSQWGKLKSTQIAKPKPRPLRTLDDIPEPSAA